MGKAGQECFQTPQNPFGTCHTIMAKRRFVITGEMNDTNLGPPAAAGGSLQAAPLPRPEGGSRARGLRPPQGHPATISRSPFTGHRLAERRHRSAGTDAPDPAWPGGAGRRPPPHHRCGRAMSEQARWGRRRTGRRRGAEERPPAPQPPPPPAAGRGGGRRGSRLAPARRSAQLPAALPPARPAVTQRPRRARPLARSRRVGSRSPSSPPSLSAWRARQAGAATRPTRCLPAAELGSARRA